MRQCSIPAARHGNIAQTAFTQSESHKTIMMNENLVLQDIYVQTNSYREVMISVMRSV